MKHLKIYENFDTNEKTIKIIKKLSLYKFKLNEDGSVDVDDDVYFPSGAHIEKIPIKFNRVNGNFSCSHNDLTTLENCPKYVGGEFNCIHNKLITLLNGPEHVGGHYLCGLNNLKDMYGFPKFFKGLLNMNSNPVYEIVNLSIKYLNPSISQIIPTQIRFIKIMNEYQVIRNGDTIIESRLLDVLSEMGIKEFPKNLEFRFAYYYQNYKLI